MEKWRRRKTQQRQQQELQVAVSLLFGCLMKKHSRPKQGLANSHSQSQSQKHWYWLLMPENTQ